MTKPIDPECHNFEKALLAARTPIGNGLVSLDNDKILHAVRTNKNGAWKWAEVQCSNALADPLMKEALISMAFTVGFAYRQVFNDVSLLQSVFQSVGEKEASRYLSERNMFNRL
jgi:hypothetical protein